MLNSNETLEPELIVAVREAIEARTSLTFSILLDAYKEKNSDQPELGEADLVEEILEAGGYQGGEGVNFEDSVLIGAIAMGEDLEVF